MQTCYQICRHSINVTSSVGLYNPRRRRWKRTGQMHIHGTGERPEERPLPVHCPFAVFRRLSLHFHCLSPPFTALPLFFAAFHCPSTVFCRLSLPFHCLSPPSTAVSAVDLQQEPQSKAARISPASVELPRPRLGSPRRNRRGRSRWRRPRSPAALPAAAAPREERR